MIALHSPLTGAPLHISDYALVGSGGERWPVIDGIAFLRMDRRALADAALAALDAGDIETATMLLLGDQDPWARALPPDESARRTLIRGRDKLSFREAMALLEFGPVADYFAHRWSDPTFLSGLALLDAHGGSPVRAVELACGAGHFLRVMEHHVPEVIGVDIAFAKLWLARHWIAPSAILLCFDAAAPWPMAGGHSALVFCHDAFYFLPDKAHVAAEMRRIAGAGGHIIIGHAHNALADNFSNGAPLAPAEYMTLFAPALLYDDVELTQAYVDARIPRVATTESLANAAALAIVSGSVPSPDVGAWSASLHGTKLARNPIYVAHEDGTQTRLFPSDRYASEYGFLVTYPTTTKVAENAVAGDVDPMLIRQRVFLDLPDRW